jgi:CubicO group peptidase (beta-lactamase class C family)
MRLQTGAMIFRKILFTAAAALTLGSPAQSQQESVSPHNLALAAGYKAAFTCSGVFNAGQTEAEVAADDLTRIYPGYRPLIGDMPVGVDRENRRVLVHFAETMPPRVAVWRPHLGCVQLPIGADPDAEWDLPQLSAGIEAPVLAEADALPWPRGDAGAVRPMPRPAQGALNDTIADAFDRVTYGEGTETTAVVVVLNGEIVGEQYREGYNLHRPQRTWSVAKSIAATVIGAAAHQGIVDLSGPAPVPAWQVPGDPRAAITWHNLFHMGSGLWSPTAGNRTDDIYFGGMAVTDSIPSLPLEAAPGTRWRYANNDTLLAVLALRAAMADDARYRSFPFTGVFWRIGMTRTTPETDWQGNFVFSSQVWTTARDLARLGLLYLDDGVWQGERILPEGWSDFVAMPAPAQPTGRGGVGYGAQFWLFGSGQGLPEGTYAAMGNRGQYVMIVPARNVVIVRRGFDAVGDGERFDIARFSHDVLEALNR